MLHRGRAHTLDEPLCPVLRQYCSMYSTYTPCCVRLSIGIVLITVQSLSSPSNPWCFRRVACFTGTATPNPRSVQPADLPPPIRPLVDYMMPCCEFLCLDKDSLVSPRELFLRRLEGAWKDPEQDSGTPPSLLIPPRVRMVQAFQSTPSPPQAARPNPAPHDRPTISSCVKYLLRTAGILH